MAYTPTRAPMRYATIEDIAADFERRAMLAASPGALEARAYAQVPSPTSTPVEASDAPSAASGDAAIERLRGMNEAFSRMITIGCDSKTAAMMVLAILSSSPQTRKHCRAWCVERLSTRDDPTGTNMTKIVPSVPARRQ